MTVNIISRNKTSTILDKILKITFETPHYLTLSLYWICFYFIDTVCSLLLQYQLKFTVLTSSLIAGTVLYSTDEMSENTFSNVSFFAVNVKDTPIILISFSFSCDTFTTFKTKRLELLLTR